MEKKATEQASERQIPTSALIMVVDDQEANIVLLEGILEQAGYTEIVGITDSRQVVSRFNEAQPDIILLDLMMPHFTGFQIMEQLKPLIQENDYLPILVLSADITPEAKQQALTMGANDFLAKPLDLEEVLLRINNLLRTRFLHLELQQQKLLLEEKVQTRTRELAETLEQVETAQETERRRVSMDIHDGPLQSLGVCTLAVDRIIRLHERGNRGDHTEVVNELRDLRGYLNSTIEELRLVLADLSLEILTSYGLVVALRDYGSRVSEAMNITLQISLDADESKSLPPKVQLLMYRLAQEALANVRKHSSASSVVLSLSREGNCLYMTVDDNGTGFDPGAVLSEHHAGKHLGLRSMLERIHKAHGELVIDSAPGTGTRLNFRAPLGAKA